MITKLIHRILAQWEIPPEEINNGYCADFATNIHDRLPAAKVLANDDLGPGPYLHTFVLFDGRYYDAECPGGVDDWRDLPIWGRP